MYTTINTIRDTETPELIEKLIEFCGRNKVDRAIQKYKKSLQFSGRIYSDYYLKLRHPWWEAFIIYKKYLKSRKSFSGKLDERIVNLVCDAKMIELLQQTMPNNVMKKFKRDLLDDDNAVNYLFELKTAWQYYLKGHKIVWYDNKNKHPEFKVITDTFEFNVECKRISVDASRKIRRSDFYKFIEMFVPKLVDMKIAGSIEIFLQSRLQSSPRNLKQVSSRILELIKKGNFVGDFDLEDITLKTNIVEGNNIIVDMKERFTDFYSRKPYGAHGILVTRDFNNYSVDPLEIIVKSEKSDEYLTGIYEKLQTAASTQLSNDIPGIIACYIPEIIDFTGLEKDSSLANMTYKLFSKKENEHLGAIIYVSDTLFLPKIYGRLTQNPALLFRNHYCKYETIKNYQFLNGN